MQSVKVKMNDEARAQFELWRVNNPESKKPTKVEVKELSEKTNLSIKQVWGYFCAKLRLQHRSKKGTMVSTPVAAISTPDAPYDPYPEMTRDELAEFFTDISDAQIAQINADKLKRENDEKLEREKTAHEASSALRLLYLLADPQPSLPQIKFDLTVHVS